MKCVVLLLKAGLTCAAAAASLQGAPAEAQQLRLGAASVALAPKGGDRGPPPASGRVEALLATAAQTNQWYSTLLFAAQPEPIYVQPISVRPVSAGLEFVLPVKKVVPTERRDVEIHYPHESPLLLSPTAFAPGAPKLARAGDWSIEIAMDRGADRFRSGVAHGSPYVQIRLSRGDLRLRLPEAGQRLDALSTDAVLVLRVQGRAYMVAGPAGSRWEQAAASDWLLRLPPGEQHVAAAPLPDESPQSVALLRRHAFAFIDDTRVNWRYDVAASRVVTTFTASTRAVDGGESTPLLGLYPHHWFRNDSVAGRLGPVYPTLRGELKLLAAASFDTVHRYHGFVPRWPALADGPRLSELRELMNTDVRNARRMMLEIGNGPYWQGKGLQRIAKLLDVVEVQGDTAASARLLDLLKGRMETWFSGESGKTYFQRDAVLGSVLAHPQEYFSIEQMNDHHFHYGYWIRTAAEIALRDPQWASPDRYGRIVDLLVADIATTRRGAADFPFLRTFDPYEGHSWASGIGLGAWGNNQESSSEAINAWAALILWGEITGNRELRDLGVYLFATESDAVQHYWFDTHGLVFAPEYRALRADVSMLFGGKVAHNTWWTDEPRQIKGINLLPVTTASMHLARDPAYLRRSLSTLDAEVAAWLGRGKSYKDVDRDIWQDIFAKVLALADPAEALRKWNRWGSVEFGDTRSHTLHWLLSLDAMGVPDLTVTADTPLYSVFVRADGRRTYLAYNAGAEPMTVRFSDGRTLTVAPRSLGRAN